METATNGFRNAIYNSQTLKSTQQTPKNINQVALNATNNFFSLELTQKIFTQELTTANSSK